MKNISFSGIRFIFPSINTHVELFMRQQQNSKDILLSFSFGYGAKLLTVTFFCFWSHISQKESLEKINFVFNFY